jgi:DNA polymerase-4
LVADLDHGLATFGDIASAARQRRRVAFPSPSLSDVRHVAPVTRSALPCRASTLVKREDRTHDVRIAADEPAHDSRAYRVGIAEWVLHVDLDQFLAAVEKRRRPELAHLPVIVGGDGNPARPRQVVATASYEARAFGVRSGMPLAAAKRRCPDAVFLPHDRPVYEAASGEVMTTLRAFPVVVEVWGWDEAFLGATTDDPESLAAEIKAGVLASTSLTCAVGIGDSRLLAKTATGFAKPGGIARLMRSQWFDVMGDRPVTAIWGIGDRTAARLEDLGVRTVRDLAGADLDLLRATFGPAIGGHLKVLGLGGDDAPIVDEPWVARSRSKEETFVRDLADRDQIEEHVVRMAREVTESVVAEGRIVTHVAIKVRTSTFFTRTKSGKLPEPTTDPDAVAAHARVVLGRFELTRPVRLLGVRVMLEMPSP